MLSAAPLSGLGCTRSAALFLGFVGCRRLEISKLNQNLESLNKLRLDLLAAARVGSKEIPE